MLLNGVEKTRLRLSIYWCGLFLEVFSREASVAVDASLGQLDPGMKLGTSMLMFFCSDLALQTNYSHIPFRRPQAIKMLTLWNFRISRTR
ncbi:hypothetical protein ACRALDRAFT_208103 [Sodiomyces alcalophilus JCM 7366]|uniref:uncharacterized protein n=1 Tax=Sodiomyces alcalophilus JCM 7366 TaxID=591952 RepID=UPI0039B5BFCD